MNATLVLWQRKWIIVSATAVAVVVAAGITLRMPDTYMATSSVLVSRPDGAQGTASEVPSAETFKEIATTSAVVTGALERLGDAGTEAGVPMTVDRLRRKMRVETHEERGQYNSVRIAPLLDLAVRDSDASRAAAIANAWAESFQDVSRRFRGEGSRQLAQILKERAAATEERLLGSEEIYRAFQVDSALGLLQAEARVQNEKLAAVRATRLDLEAQVAERLRMIDALRADLPDAGGGDAPAAADRDTLAARLERAGEQLKSSMEELRVSRRAAELQAMESDLLAARARLDGHRDILQSIEDRRARAVAEIERIEALLPTAARESDAEALKESLAVTGGREAGVPELLLLERLQDPALQALRERYYQGRVDAEALGPLIETHRQRIGELRDEITTLEETVAERRDRITLLQERRDRDLDRVHNLEGIRLEVRREIVTLGLEAHRLRARAAALTARERVLREESVRLQARLVGTALRDEQLHREVEQLRQIHGRLVARAQEAQAIEAADASDIALVSPAAVPDRPVAPRPLLNLLAAALFGALASSALVLLTSGPAPETP